MIQENKELLLKYLCIALPYGIIVNAQYKDGEGWKTEDKKILGIYKDGQIYLDSIYTTVNRVRPYLRPMSSMTDEEYEEYKTVSIWGYVRKCKIETTEVCPRIEGGYDWLIKHHFDFMGLIPKGLAVEMTKENDSHKQYVVITQTILDYIKKNSRNFENLTPILGEKWIIDGEFTYSGVCGGQPVIEIHKTTGEFMRLPKSLIKIE